MGLLLGRSKGRRTLDKVEGFSTSIGEGTVFKGSFHGSGNYIIHGTVEGDCDLEGTLIVGESGRWVGSIRAGTILIAGCVDGDILAKEKMEVVSTARIKGKIACSVLAIAEGAVHEGQIQMTTNTDVKRFKDRRESTIGDVRPDSSRRTPSPADEVQQTLRIENKEKSA